VLLRDEGVSTVVGIFDVDGDREKGLPTPRCVPLSSEEYELGLYSQSYDSVPTLCEFPGHSLLG